MIVTGFVAMTIQSISAAWEFVWAMGAGVGAVLILRWFWWRINAWSELSAMATSLVLAVALVLRDWWTYSNVSLKGSNLVAVGPLKPGKKEKAFGS